MLVSQYDVEVKGEGAAAYVLACRTRSTCACAAELLFSLLPCCLQMQQREVKQKWRQWSMEATWLNKSCVSAERPSLLSEIHGDCEGGAYICVCERERKMQR